MQDAEMVFHWRNDSFIVSLSSSQRMVYWEEHLKWFEDIVNDDSKIMFIIEKEGQPLGQVRFDKADENICAITVYMLREFTGKGYGVKAIEIGCLQIFDLWDVEEIIACVRSNNRNSRAAFLKAGFFERDLKWLCPENHFTFSLIRSNFILNKKDSIK
jgi:RimJ/RimL family protein N-acetyltransferase